MKSYKTITLGCKVNQCESAALGHLIEAEGYSRSGKGDSASVVIINTCTVTGKAAMQSRQAIRQAIRNHPAAQIVVTGCYAQTAPKEIQAIEGIDLIVGHHDKLGIARMLAETGSSSQSARIVRRGIGQPCEFSSMPSVAFESRTRAFLKIQDGCNTRCTYCIVPYARGSSRSMPTDDVIEHVHRLVKEQIKEVVLTGIHLGAYGEDLSPGTSLAAIVEKMLKETAIDRIRLSSIEPTEIDDRLIDLAFQFQGRICRHFHIPLQSGDDETLRRMGRPYTSERFARTIQTIHKRIPGAAIGIDVMAGFPGESEAAFSRTYQLLDALPISYLHVFPYSPRKGTPAASYTPKVPERVAKERCRELRALSEEKRAAFFRSMIDQQAAVLTETATEPVSGLAAGLSDNYVPVAVAEDDVQENEVVMIRITEITPEGKVIGNYASGGKK